MTQQDVIQEHRNKRESKTDYMEKRRRWLTGEDKYRKFWCGEVTAKVTISQANFSEEFGEAFFYEFIDYIKQMDRGLDTSTWSQRQRFLHIKKNYTDAVIVRDRFGNYGVKVRHMP